MLGDTTVVVVVGGGGVVVAICGTNKAETECEYDPQIEQSMMKTACIIHTGGWWRRGGRGYMWHKQGRDRV